MVRRAYVFIMVLGVVPALLAVRPGRAAPETSHVPIRVDLPVGTSKRVALPVTGGIPFPRGRLASADHVRVLIGGSNEIPAQVTRSAVWPDGSVKWVLIDVVLSPSQLRSKTLRLEYGASVRRAKVPKPLVAQTKSGGVSIKGDGLSATVTKRGELSGVRIGGRKVLGSTQHALETLRVDAPRAFPGPSRVCFDEKAKAAHGKLVAPNVEVEVEGPIRVRVKVSGQFRVPGWGKTLPDSVLRAEPPELVPFTTRYTFHRGSPMVVVDHQLVFSGEPDRDFITRWGIDLEDQGAGSAREILEPGRDEDRLCWAPLRDGLALVREGWENRPCAVGGAIGEDARIDFWPRAAGPWDLRRFARAWSVGETGEKERPEDMERYAKYAARGLAKSHQVVLWLGGEGKKSEDVARALSGRALLVAPPAWYRRSFALEVSPPGPKDRYADLEAGVRRYLDYFLHSQDLYRWHGKLAYGFWQTRNGDIHRHDRWDRDYGRWGWSLNDGAGRIGHVLMLEYLRTLDRRYLRAGEAFNRATYDTSMVHTEMHLENARANWWRAKGLNHRHNVQPFGCPYIGMRGSNPGGHRILWHLTGDGVIKDGLDLVMDAAIHGRFGGSGGPDGQGSAALAFLFAYETTGDDDWLEACRALLDKSNLFPPQNPSRLSYGPGFGLFLAAGEYTALVEDQPFDRRFLELADCAVRAKDKTPFLTVLSDAYGVSQKAVYLEALEEALGALDFTNSLAELPRDTWPGHGGPHRPPSRANVGRDLPHALVHVRPPLSKLAWPKPPDDPVTLPARVPDDWFRPEPLDRSSDRLLEAAKLFSRESEPDERFRPFVVLAETDKAGNWIATKRLDGSLRGVKHVVIARKTGRGDSTWRVEMAVDAGVKHVAAFGISVPLEMSERPATHHLQAPGAFRVERWRVDANDEAIPGWLNSDRRTRWPIWRGGGILLGLDDAYRIFKLNRTDTSPLFVDEGFGSPGWFDVSDRGGETHRGVSARLLPGATDGDNDAWRALTYDADMKELRIAFVSVAGLPVVGPCAGGAEIVFHDGWRPPFAQAPLTRVQYMRMLDDLDYAENIGLFALRFLLSETHKVGEGDWKRGLADRGITARQLLLSMTWKDALERHCKRIGVRYDAKRTERTVAKVIDHYARRR